MTSLPFLARGVFSDIVSLNTIRPLPHLRWLPVPFESRDTIPVWCWPCWFFSANCICMLPEMWSTTKGLKLMADVNGTINTLSISHVSSALPLSCSKHLPHINDHVIIWMLMAVTAQLHLPNWYVCSLCSCLYLNLSAHLPFSCLLFFCLTLSFSGCSRGYG